jgi:DNA polymerase eta
VLARQQAKSIGCSKNFRGKQALDTIKKVEYWVKNLYEELEERLEDDKTIV